MNAAKVTWSDLGRLGLFNTCLTAANTKSTDKLTDMHTTEMKDLDLYPAISHPVGNHETVKNAALYSGNVTTWQYGTGSPWSNSMW